MRQSFSRQRRLDCKGPKNIILNFECRHEIIPILSGLQHIYSQPALRDDILKLIAKDVNEKSRDDCGRRGMDYWQILVLSAVRLGCDLTYDALQDLAEQHNALRHIMGVGDWEDESFDWRRIHDNICLVRPDTIAAIDRLIVGEGHRLVPDACKKIRADHRTCRNSGRCVEPGWLATVGTFVEEDPQNLPPHRTHRLAQRSGLQGTSQEALSSTVESVGKNTAQGTTSV
jgi:hypothetical protein